MTTPRGGPYGRPPAPPIAVAGRVLAFVTLGLVTMWAVVLGGVAVYLAGVGTLTIMWGPPCVDGTDCGPSLWLPTGVAIAGSAVTLLILAVALPVAWRRPSLLVWSVIALGVAVLTAVWAVANAGL